MNKKTKKIKEILDQLYPETPIPLNHNSPYTLLIAVMLSAQTTDKKVNEVEITKTSQPKLKNDFIAFLQQMTKYDVPQIIFKKFKSEKKYENWIRKSILN